MLQQCCDLLRLSPNIPNTICVLTSNYTIDCNSLILCGAMLRRTALYCEHSPTSAVRRTSFTSLKTGPNAACVRMCCERTANMRNTTQQLLQTSIRPFPPTYSLLRLIETGCKQVSTRLQHDAARRLHTRISTIHTTATTRQCF